MKRCSQCGEELSLEEFGIKRKAKDGRQSACKECRKVYAKQWYKENSATHIARVKSAESKRLTKYYQIVNDLKSVPCADCGQVFDPVCMDFDHLPEYEKTDNVATMLRVKSLATIKEEILKCEVVCSNCHRLRTKNRRESSRSRLELGPSPAP